MANDCSAGLIDETDVKKEGEFTSKISLVFPSDPNEALFELDFDLELINPCH